MTRVVSFDVFDTLLTRRHIHPTHVFLRAGQILVDEDIWPGSAGEFRRARVDAELQSRGGMPEIETDLSIVVQALIGLNGLDPAAADRIAQVELEAEQSSLHVVRSGADALRRARLEADAVVYLTDMYLPGDFIELQLRRYDIWRDGDALFVSGEVGLNKASGRLFDHVAGQFDSGATFTHYGDNPHSDVYMARTSGWGAVHLEDAVPTRYEVLPPRNDEDLDLSEFAGAMRLARLDRHSSPDAKFDAIYDVGLEVLGPVLVSFGLQVSEWTAAHGVDHLYCLARDGQVMKEAFDALADAGVPLPPRTYLMVSRIALRRPTTAITRDAPDWLFEESGNLSFATVMARLDLDVDEWYEWALRHGWAGGGPDEPLKKAGRAQLEEWTSLGPMFDAFMGHCDEQLLAAKAYFREVGLFDCQHPAICDVGWRGSMQTALATLLTSVQPTALAGYYIGMREHPVQRDDFSTHAWLDRRKEFLRFPVFAELMELLLSADHGGVLRIAQTEAGVQPELAGAIAPGQQTRVSALRAGVAASLLFGVAGLPERKPNVTDLAIRNLTLFVTRPSNNEADEFGEWPVSIDATHDHYEQLAPTITIPRLARMLKRPSGHRKYWLAAIRQRSGVAGDCLASFVVARQLFERLSRQLRLRSSVLRHRR